MTEVSRPAVLVLASTYPRRVDDPEPGFVHELCRRLVGTFEVIAVVPDAPGADASGFLDGVEVIRYRYAPRRLQTLVNDGGIAANLRRSKWKWLLLPSFVLGQYLAARKIAQQRKITVIHAHWLIPQGLVAFFLRRRFGLPFLVTSHGGDLFGLKGGLAEGIKQRVAGEAAAMTVVSSAMAEEVERQHLHPRRLDILPMGADLEERFVPDNTERTQSELLFVGRLVPKKGLCHLLDAMPLIMAAYPGVTLTIAGFGPEEGALREQVDRLGIASEIHFLGAIPQVELPALYRRAAVFVAPFVRDSAGDQEGLPVALMEAIGCGCPVVAGNVAGVKDLLGDMAGVVVNPRDMQALAESVLRALREPSRARESAAAIHRLVSGKIDWRHIAERYAVLLGECAALQSVRQEGRPG